MKKLLTLALTTMLVCAMVLPAMASAFPDVPENHWAYKAVEELYAAGLVIGYPDGTFGGQRSLTRYEYAEIVARLYQRLQEIAAESGAQAGKALDAAMVAQDMAKKAQLAADAAANATPVERIIEKHIIETKPDIPYEEVYKQAKDLAVLVESLKEEFSSELAALGEDVEKLDGRVTALEGKVAELDTRQTKTETDVAALQEAHRRFTVGGSFEATLKDTTVTSTMTDSADGVEVAYIDPYKTDFDGDDFTWLDHGDTDDVYKQGAKMETALTLNLGFSPAEGVDVKAKVKLTDSFAAADSGQTLNLKDVALEATSDGLIRRAYFGDLDATDAFAGYSRFIKTRTELVEVKEVDSTEGTQIDLATGKFNGQVAVIALDADAVLAPPMPDEYYIMSRGEYAISPAFTVGGSMIKTATAITPEPSGLDRSGMYAKGNLATVDYLVGFYGNSADQSALELSLAKTFGIMNVGLDYTSNYDEEAYTMISAETADDFTLGALPMSVYGEFGSASEADEAHYKVGFQVVDYPLGILNIGGGYEMVAKETSDDIFEVAAWDNESKDYGKVSFNAGFDYAIGSVQFTPGLEWYSKDVTENAVGNVDHTDSRTTLKLGVEAPVLSKGTLTGAVKRINDKGYNTTTNLVVESNATGIDADLTYPIGAINLTVGGEWLKYDETLNSKYNDFDYFVIKSGVKFDF